MTSSWFVPTIFLAFEGIVAWWPKHSFDHAASAVPAPQRAATQQAADPAMARAFLGPVALLNMVGSFRFEWPADTARGVCANTIRSRRPSNQGPCVSPNPPEV